MKQALPQIVAQAHRPPRSRAEFKATVSNANPVMMTKYPAPIKNGADDHEMKMLELSRTEKTRMERKTQQTNSLMKTCGEGKEDQTQIRHNFDREHNKRSYQSELLSWSTEQSEYSRWSVRCKQ